MSEEEIYFAQFRGDDPVDDNVIVSFYRRDDNGNLIDTGDKITVNRIDWEYLKKHPKLDSPEPLMWVVSDA